MAGDGILPHGWTVDGVIKLASLAASSNRFRLLPCDEARQAAAVAMVELLYSSAEPPSTTRLLDAAKHVLGHHVDMQERDRGDDRARPGQGHTAKGWMRFWVNPPGEPLDERVCERLAVWQVYSVLTERDQEVLWALAWAGDYGAAAAWLGITRGTFTDRLMLARRHARQAWAWPDPPPPQWGRDTHGARKPGHGTIMQQRAAQRRRRERAA